MSPPEPISPFERVALALFRATLLLLPRWLRRRREEEMALVLVERIRRASGLSGRLRALLHESGGVLLTAARARLAPISEDPSTTGREDTMESLLNDVRFALRGLRRNPGFTAVALLTVTLGIGANTAVFSLVNGIVLRPLPYPEPEEIVLLHQSNPRSGDMLGRMSLQDLEDWQARNRSLEAATGFAAAPTILTGQGDPVELELTYVTPGFFDLLGVRAELGRNLQPDDHRLALPNAVISHAFWQTVLNADPGAIGNPISLRGEPFTVVGVMAASLRHPTPETDVWVPSSLVRPNQFSNGMPGRDARFLSAVGRLAPGSDADAAQRELTAISGQLAAAYPETNQDWTAATVVPLHEAVVGDVDRALVTVFGVVGFLLLIACANLANLLLARGSARQREIAVRVTLGAGRGRMIRQLLTESLVLALLGGLLGLALSWWGLNGILAISAEILPRVQEVRMDGRVIGFTLLLTLVTGLLFGAMPAFRMAADDPQRDLRGGRGDVGGGGGLRNGLVVAEVSLAVLLLVGAGLMGRSFLALRSVDPGFEPEHVLTATMQLNLTGVSEEEMAGFLVQRRDEILERVREIPGVESVGMINVFPLHPGAFSMEYTRADGAGEDGGVHADTRYVDPGYLETMRIPLLRGEPLPERLERGQPVPVLMSESAARRLWADRDPVGERIVVPWGESVVVGVVGDVRQIGLAEEAQPAVYFPQAIAPRLMATLVVRTPGDPAALAEPVRQVIQEIDPNQPIRTIQPLEALLAESLAQERFFTVLFAIFGGVAITLSAIGVYGVLAYAVRQRTREIGVRMALGASGVDVLRMVAVNGLRPVGLGLLLGSLAALALTRVLESQLYGVAPTDPVAFLFASGFLGGVAVLAMYVPARRAMAVPPLTALRE